MQTPGQNRILSPPCLTDAADHDLDEAGLVLVLEVLLLGPRLLDQQVRHALPVLQKKSPSSNTHLIHYAVHNIHFMEVQGYIF